MCPPLVAADRPLKNKLVDFEKKPLVLSVRPRRLALVGRREDNVANPDQLRGANWIGPEMAQETVPVPMVYANRRSVAGQDRIRWQRQRHDELKERPAVHTVSRDPVHDLAKLILDDLPIGALRGFAE